MEVVRKHRLKFLTLSMFLSCCLNTSCSLKNPNKNLYDDPSGLSNTLLEKDPSKTISDYSAKEVLYIVNTEFSKAPIFFTEVTGDVEAGAYNQKIRSRRWKTNDEIVSETISTSALVKVGDQSYFKDEMVISRKADKISSLTSVTWGTDYKKSNHEGYKKKYGELPSYLSHYIFNDNSIKKATQISENGERYVYEYLLDNYKATPKYQIKMKTNGDLADYPKFEKIVLTLTVSKDFLPIEIVIDEDYTMNKTVLGANLHLSCNGQMKETFSFNTEDSLIPPAYLEFFRGK